MRLRIALTVLVALLAAQQLPVDLGRSLVGQALVNGAHVPFFAAVTLCLWIVFDRPGRADSRRAGLAALLAAAIAVGSESVQILLPGRSPDAADLLLDAIGILCAIAGAVVWRRRQGRAPRLLLVAALGTAATLAEPWVAYSALAHQRAAAPRLADFDAASSAYLMGSNSGARRVAAPSEWAPFAGRRVVRVDLADVDWPGVVVCCVVPDWSGHRTLRLEVFVAGGQPMLLTVGVRHRGLRGTARHHEWRAPPGASALRLPVDALAPGGNVAVTDVLVYGSRADAGRTFYVGEMALE